MVINLPYNLREGQIAYAAKVMANFRALLNAYNQAGIPGFGEGDVGSMLQLLYQAMVKADQPGNAEDIVFSDGDTLEQKFAAGTLNAELLTGEGMFYFYVDVNDGHLYAVTSEAMEQSDFSIGEDGHLLYTLGEPNENSHVNIFDLGQVKGDKGDPGQGGMNAAVYDPNSVQKDMNTYTGYFALDDSDWGSYFLTFDDRFSEDKIYYVLSGDEYVEAVIMPGAPVDPGVYYERLPANECFITDDQYISGAEISDHITGSTGHVLVGPALNATDGGKLAWQRAAVVPVSQGAGSTEPGVGLESAWLRIRALGRVPEDDVMLMLTFYV